jgi:hypothetical protein
MVLTYGKTIMTEHRSNATFKQILSHFISHVHVLATALKNAFVKYGYN